MLVTHAGGWEATMEDIKAVPLPEETDTYVPVPYDDFINSVITSLPRYDLHLQTERYALARNGNRLFGVLTCTNGNNNNEWGLAIGLRTSYDKSFKNGLVAGHNVFVCDNLAFSGEINMKTPHTKNVHKSLDTVISNLLESVLEKKQEISIEIESMKNVLLSNDLAYATTVEAAIEGVITPNQIISVVSEWQKPTYDAFSNEFNSWRLWNAFTHVAKDRPARRLFGDTLKLNKLFRERELIHA